MFIDNEAMFEIIFFVPGFISQIFKKDPDCHLPTASKTNNYKDRMPQEMEIVETVGIKKAYLGMIVILSN